MVILNSCLEAISILFSNPYMFSLLGLLALALCVYAFKILFKF